MSEAGNPKSVRLAVAQTPVREDPRDGDALRESGHQVRALMREASARGARIVHFPEGAICSPHKLVMSVDGPDAVGPADWNRYQWPVLRAELAAITELARELRLWAVIAERDGILLITDKGFASKPFEKDLAEQGIELLRPSLKREKKRYGEPMLKKVRQLIESVNDTLKGQLDLEQHGGRTFEGVAIRVAQRVLAMAAGIWHNNAVGAPVTRSLIAYDH